MLRNYPNLVVISQDGNLNKTLKKQDVHFSTSNLSVSF